MTDTHQEPVPAPSPAPVSPVELAPAIERLTRDIRTAARSLTEREARYLVDRYYQSQEDRKRAANQQRAGVTAGEPSEVIHWLTRQSETLEERIKGILDAYSAAHPVGKWARSQKGIGPVIAAGLLAHIDINKAPTAGHIWAFAGLDPRVKWDGQVKTGQEIESVLGKKVAILTEEDVHILCDHFRRKPETIFRYATKDNDKLDFKSVCAALARKPWNSNLKTLCWKIGESFVKVSGGDAFYGRMYREYRAEEDMRNARGDFAEQAADKLRRFRIGKTTEAYAHYSVGRLPKAHLYARAKRRVVKMFLSHLHDVMTWCKTGDRAPRPWSIEFGGHTHEVEAPEAPWRRSA